MGKQTAATSSPQEQSDEDQSEDGGLDVGPTDGGSSEGLESQSELFEGEEGHSPASEADALDEAEEIDIPQLECVLCQGKNGDV